MTTAPAPEPTNTPARGDRPPHAGAFTLTRTQQNLVFIVAIGALLMAGIGFAGSYTAVTELAAAKGFGWFAKVFTIGVDAGILVLIALDLLLTWLRIPFPLLRQIAWLLTAATIVFNAAASWPDPIGSAMHAVIPVLFIAIVEAARHAIGRIADITADKHMDGVRLSRWLLSPLPTFRLWRRMKLWELRSYDEVIRFEQDRLVYQARLRARYGRAWRRKAPVESVLPLRLARFGKPITDPVAPQTALPPVPAGDATATLERIPLPAMAPKTVAPATATERATADATTGATTGATDSSMAPAMDATNTRHESATVAGRHDATNRRHETSATTPRTDATGGATTGATDNEPAATVAPRPTPRRTAAPRPTATGKTTSGVTRTQAKEALRTLYTTLGRRPIESEMVTELERIGSPYTSRQFAQKLRGEIETKQPHLAALGSDNVRALTGTDG